MSPQWKIEITDNPLQGVKAGSLHMWSFGKFEMFGIKRCLIIFSLLILFVCVRKKACMHIWSMYVLSLIHI